MCQNCCSKCFSEGYIVNGECLKCIEGECNYCKLRAPLYYIDCEHKFCKDCIEKNIKCAICYKEYACIYCKQIFYSKAIICQAHPSCGYCEQLSMQYGCLICNDLEKIYRCSYCLMVYDNLTSLICEHKACLECNTLNNNEFCDICEPKECLFCHQLKKIIPHSCAHKKCEDCNNIIQQIGYCPECERSEFIFKCDFCLQFNITKNPLNCINHNLCSNCENKQPESCILCLSTCCYCKEISRDRIITCKDSYCLNCITKGACKNCCSVCYREGYMENGVCLKCIEGECT